MKDENCCSAKKHIKGYRLLTFMHMLAKLNYYGSNIETFGRVLILNTFHNKEKCQNMKQISLK